VSMANALADDSIKWPLRPSVSSPWQDVDRLSSSCNWAEFAASARGPVILPFRALPSSQGEARRNQPTLSTQEFATEWDDSRSSANVDDSPFSDLQRERLRDVTDELTRVANTPLRFCAERLLHLVESSAEDWPTAELPTVQAIKSFMRILSGLPTVRTPGITLSDGGQIWAQWRRNDVTVALVLGAGGLPTIAALLPDAARLGRCTHFNFTGSEEESVKRLITDPALRSVCLDTEAVDSRGAEY
jgi:hypothetical protein